MIRVVLLTLLLTACASADDVSTRGSLLEQRLDPNTHGFCSPEARARGLAEVAFARGATQRGDAIAAKVHLDRAADYAADAETDTTCGPVVTPKDPTEPILLKPKDLDEDGQPDGVDPDDDNDGASD